MQEYSSLVNIPAAAGAAVGAVRMVDNGRRKGRNDRNGKGQFDELL